MSEGEKSSILEGIRVVENSVWIAGSVTTNMLGDLGAEIIKVERPGGGPEAGSTRLHGAEQIRRVGGHVIRSDPTGHNKKRITVDATKEKGRQVLYRLIEKSDAFLHNLTPGKVVDLGLDYSTLCRYNPKLVYGTICGYGRHGPDSLVPSQDPTGLARSGLMFAAHPGKDPSYLVGILGDTMTGTMLAYGMVAALLHQKRTGVGQEVSISQLGSLMWLHYIHIAVNLLNGQEFKEHVRAKAENPLLNWYQCQDGKWICLGSHQADKDWPDYCEILGIKDLEQDPRFVDSAARTAHAAELIAIMDKKFATMPREEWLRNFRKANPGLAVAPLNRVSELSSDPQVPANNYVIPFEHHIAGKMQVFGRPIEFSKTPSPARQRAPELGENTEEVLTGLLGYSWDEVESLAKEGVI